MKKISLITCLVLSLTAFTQEDIIIIDKSDLKSYKKEKAKREIKLNNNTRVIKFAPLNMLAGEINFGYERQLSIKGSIDLEFGPTISKIGIGSVDNHAFNSLGPSSRHNSGLGFLIGAGYRFYPLDETEALNRFYVSPVLKYKTYNYSIEEITGDLENTKGHNTQLNFYFNFGYQIWAAESFSIDFYGGMGLGYQEIDDAYAITEYNEQTMEWETTWQNEYNSGARYVFNMGLKVGIGSQ